MTTPDSKKRDSKLAKKSTGKSSKKKKKKKLRGREDVDDTTASENQTLHGTRVRISNSGANGPATDSDATSERGSGLVVFPVANGPSSSSGSSLVVLPVANGSSSSSGRDVVVLPAANGSSSSGSGLVVQPTADVSSRLNGDSAAGDSHRPHDHHHHQSLSPTDEADAADRYSSQTVGNRNGKAAKKRKKISSSPTKTKIADSEYTLVTPNIILDADSPPPPPMKTEPGEEIERKLTLYGCLYCQRKCANVELVMAHLSEKHGIDMDRNRPVSYHWNLSFLCTQCDEAFDEEGKLEEHLLTHDNDPGYGYDKYGGGPSINYDDMSDCIVLD